jgi:cytochrome c peroxidase
VRCILVVLLVGCSSKSEEPPAKPPPPLPRLAEFSPLPPLPPDPTNKVADDPRAAALGQMLFHDPDLSATGTVSCRTCHDGPALDDTPHHVSTGTGIGGRNAPPVLNSAYYRWTNWGGKFDSLWALVLGATANPEVMNARPADVVAVIAAQYRAEYEAIFGPLDAADVDRAYANYGKAVAAYMRKLVARDSPFDRFVAGDAAALSDAAKRGYELFLAHCASCHAGPHFSDDKFHALAAAQFGEHVPAVDLGRYTDVPPLLANKFNTAGAFSDGPSKLDGLAQSPEQKGQFRTPTLRNVAVTPPYMHAGQLATLDAVVAFYNNGGGRVDDVTKSDQLEKLGLTDEQRADLVEFMKALTDTAVPAELLEDTSR